MKPLHLIHRLGRYGLVGGVAAAVHYGALISLSVIIPAWLANPLAFLLASLVGYLGHALLTFREETGGQQFARRWLMLQYGVNLSVCGLLPLVLPGTSSDLWRNLTLVFTPTLLNAVIWSRAAQFTARRRRRQSGSPRFHADDFGLAETVDEAILDLIRCGRLHSTSLLVDGTSAETAVAAWRQLNPPVPLCLHLCLTEGPPQPDWPDLPASFGQLLLASWIPQQRRRLRPQLRRAIQRQIHRYTELTGITDIHLDGHQHIHLVPIVLECLLEHPQIRWMRTTAEPLPTGLPLGALGSAVRDGGLLKWGVLQLLTAVAKPALHRSGVQTNRHFAGVLFTGRMVGAQLSAAERCLSNEDLLLAHPAMGGNHQQLSHQGFPLSAGFFSSPWRQWEWEALRTRAPHG